MILSSSNNSSTAPIGPDDQFDYTHSPFPVYHVNPHGTTWGGWYPSERADSRQPAVCPMCRGTRWIEVCGTFIHPGDKDDEPCYGCNSTGIVWPPEKT